MRSRHPLAIGLVALALFAGACSSSKSKDASTTTVATTTADSSATTEAPTTAGSGEAPTAAALKAALLTKADLPAGFVDGTPSPSDNSKVTTVPASCGDAINAFSSSTTKNDQKVAFDSADQAVNIEQSVGAETDAATKWKAFKDILAKDCKGTVQLTLTGGLTGTLEAVDASGIGDDSVGVKLTVKGLSQGVDVEVTGYDVYVLHGSVVSSVAQLSTKVPSKNLDGGPVDLTAVTDLAKKADTKLTDAGI
ncbi:MAG: hypothetical protein JWN46_734 [Acidimicrobiales bacterium]|nr:hypothetical protein [Acidimicrobiales bacterium]